MARFFPTDSVPTMPKNKKIKIKKILARKAKFCILWAWQQLRPYKCKLGVYQIQAKCRDLVTQRQLKTAKPVASWPK